eukprot:GILI01021303.1.p1 GENE.GILI01021303.1~~GILI01021303.1.p1  ORF type:complete len:150 (+),score=6.20 GILI01021303.1:62-511(+)
MSAYTPKHVAAGLDEEGFLSGTLQPLAKNLATLMITGYILLVSDVFGVMFGSRKIFRNVLYAGLTCHALCFTIGLYLTLIVSRYDPDWENTHMRFIYAATASVVVGSLLWIFAVWPVFHLWTIPLSIVFLFFTFSLVSLLPGKKKRKAE